MTKDYTQTKSWYTKRRYLFLLGIILAPVFLILIGIVGSLYEMNRPSYYEQGSEFPLDKLPESAKDVRFIPKVAFAPWGRTYEFACTEKDFRSWVDRKRKENPELSQIRTEDEAIYPSLSRDGNAEMVCMHEVLVSDWQFEDQGLHFVYDLSRKRALRWSHSR